MLKDIIKKELLDTFTSLKFVFSFTLCLVLVMFSVYAGINMYSRELKEYDAAVATNRTNLENSTNWDAIIWMDAVKIDRHPQVLSTLVTGIQPAAGREATVNSVNSPELTGSVYDSNPMYGLFDRLDLTFVVRMVLALLAIVFSYNAISGERERGTLKLIMANQVPRARLLLGKSLGSFLCLLSAMAVPLLLSLVLLSFHREIALSGGDWIRVGMIVLLYLLYIAVFFSLGLFVSSLVRSSALSLLVLLFAWVVFIKIIPLASVMVAGQIRPIPSEQEMASRKEAFANQMLGSALPALEEWRKNNPGDWSDEQWRQKANAYTEAVYDELTAKIQKNNADIDADFQDRSVSQQSLAMTMSRISPASNMMFGAMSLGRTGAEEHRRFLSTVREYQRVLYDWAAVKSRASPVARALDGGSPKLDISDMPAFEFVPEALERSMRRALPDFGALISMLVLLFAGTFVSFLRYDVR